MARAKAQAKKPVKKPAKKPAKPRAQKFAPHQLVTATRAVRTQWVAVPVGAVGNVIEASRGGATYAIEFQDHPGVVVTVARDALAATTWGAQRIPAARRPTARKPTAKKKTGKAKGKG